MAEPLPRLSVTTCEQDFAGPGRRVEKFREQGCHVVFDNGWTVSIQWGTFHYCANRELPSDRDFDQPASDSPDAEVAAWKGEDGPLLYLDGDTVAGWQPVAHVTAALAAAERDDEDGIRAALTQETSVDA